MSRLAACDATTIWTAAAPAARTSFTKFFLEICLDQTRFMESLVPPDRLRDRILIWATEEARISDLPPRAEGPSWILYRGTLPRGEVAALLGTGDRHSRHLVAALIERDVIASRSSRTPLRLCFLAGLGPSVVAGPFH